MVRGRKRSCIWSGLALAGALAGVPVAAGAQNAGKLQIYFIDVEGGQSTLFVEPSGESLLIDTGWPGNDGRDAERIASAAKRAGLKKIDYVLITHFHQDHVGGVPQLLQRIPVGTFIDHGPNRETADADTEHGWEAYQKILAKGGIHRIVPKPGDVLPFKDMKATVVSADGKLLEHPLPGGGAANSYCAQSEKRPADQTENGRSLGVEIDFEQARVLDLGDLTWDKEMELMCPVNKLGHIDALIVSHHGWYQSSSPALVDAITPVIAIMDNGATKGGSTPTLETFAHVPGLKQLWQLHYSEEGGQAHNVQAKYIANVKAPAAHAPDAGYGLKLTIGGGQMSVLNERTGASESYPLRH